MALSPAVNAMTRQQRREVLDEILAELGCSNWFVMEPNRPESDESYSLCNPVIGRKAELAVPEGWFEDPRRYSAIGELLALAIDNSSPIALPAEEPPTHLLPNNVLSPPPVQPRRLASTH
jgi:hypothetical protein